MPDNDKIKAYFKEISCETRCPFFHDHQFLCAIK